MSAAWTDDDKRRLAPSRLAVLEIMLDEEWHRTDNLCNRIGLRNIGTLTSRIRDIKATGEWLVERRATTSKGIHEYRMKPLRKGQLSLLEGAVNG